MTDYDDNSIGEKVGICELDAGQNHNKISRKSHQYNTLN